MNRIARPRSNEAGAGIAVIMILITALIGAAGLTVFMTASDTRSTQYVSTSRAALFCAEAGLAAARPFVGNNQASWTLFLDADPTNDPAWYPYTGDLDGDGVNDYLVTVRDNDDELPPAVNNPMVDLDFSVFVVSRCVRYPDTPRTILELVQFSAAGHVYRNQSGQGASNSNNAN